MKLATWNVNGYRAVHRTTLLPWLEREEPDVLCLQEVKATAEELPEGLRTLPGYISHWHGGGRGGYSGVATFSKVDPTWVLEGIGIPEVDLEGRVLTLELDGFFLVNAYFPNSGGGPDRLVFKLEFCEAMLRFVKNLEKRGKPVVICGDFNIAHTEKDVFEPSLHANTPGCLPQERAWMDELLASGFIDVFRAGCPEGGHYTWWSYSPGEREKNRGWRIDYFVCSRALAQGAHCTHRTEVLGSDHCPVILEL